jgi:hypothetical protein
VVVKFFVESVKVHSQVKSFLQELIPNSIKQANNPVTKNFIVSIFCESNIGFCYRNNKERKTIRGICLRYCINSTSPFRNRGAEKFWQLYLIYHIYVPTSARLPLYLPSHFTVGSDVSNTLSPQRLYTVR